MSSGAIPQARYRLGAEPLEWLFRTVATAWANTSALPGYRGLSLHGLAYSELKTHLLERKECLRSKRPAGVLQEVWGLLLLCNLVRRERVTIKMSNDPRNRGHRTSS